LKREGAPRPPHDEKDRTLNARVAGWSLRGSRKEAKTDENKLASRSITPDSSLSSADALSSAAGSESKVGEYLAARSAQKMSSNNYAPGKESEPASLKEPLASDLSKPLSSYEETSSEEEESEPEAAPESSDDDDKSQEFSVQVCVVSAVDFPASVVPNLPFSPVLKVGLVKLPSTVDNPQSEEGKTAEALEEERRRMLASKIETQGLTSFPRSRVRCTSSKILSKRDNGSVEFHEEMRWDRVRNPEQMALAVELSSRAVMTPANNRESPPAQKIRPPQLPTAQLKRGVTPTKGGTAGGDAGQTGIRSLFGRSPLIRRTGSAEMEEANAAAAVAKLLVEGDGSSDAGTGPVFDSKPPNLPGNQSELNVKLRPRKRRKRVKMTDELRIGSQVIPLTCLPLSRTMKANETARIEQWFELETNFDSSDKAAKGGSSPSSSASARSPSVLLEISFSTREALDDSEDDMDEIFEKGAELKASYSKRASLKIRQSLEKERKPVSEKVEEPVLEPGIIDYICVVGARDIGDQKSDDGARGWVNTNPECCVLEQFPPNDEFHMKNGRMVPLPSKVEWFCFPEGCKLWRGMTPPNYDELNLKRFSASSPGQVATSFASFDACLGCTTSFSWFVIASNSDTYGSDLVKTYGAVIRFYVPAPAGIDPTQDDFAQTVMGAQTQDPGELTGRNRLWVPIGICLTSSLPIIGTMEVLLLRLCENLASTAVLSAAPCSRTKIIHEYLASLIVNYQKPVPGIVHCSFPFLGGERLHVALPPPRGLPALPHGSAVASVCRLLGADGLNYLLAAFLTECKILIHSDDVANLSLVAEVLTSLLYPFQWTLPYIPVLPVEMIEFIEAPLSFLLGVPSCNMKLIDPAQLEDIVVVDLDRDFSTDYFEGRRTGLKSKSPTPLPAIVASNISKAVHRLLRAEEEVEESFTAGNFAGGVSFSRMEPESLPEREFRLAVALEVCGLIRGFDECVVFSSSQPVFSVDKFLQTAPAMFEEHVSTPYGQGNAKPVPRQVISPRARRFLSLLVSCQHFHQFLESLETDSAALFHLIMGALNNLSSKKDVSLESRLLTIDSNKTVGQLCKSLQRMEDKIATYRVKTIVDHINASADENDKIDAGGVGLFPRDLLQPIVVDSKSQEVQNGSDGIKHVSVEYLVELEKNPWRYRKLVDICVGETEGNAFFSTVEKVTLQDALGERRYRSWKMSSGEERFDFDEFSVFSDDGKSRTGSVALNLSSLLTGEDLAADSMSTEASKDIETLRRCLDQAKLSSETNPNFFKDNNGEELVLEAEVALQNKSAQRFLLTVLNKRLLGEKEQPTPRRRSHHSEASKLDTNSFEVLYRLGWAMLDACVPSDDYESAYSLLKLMAGLFCSIEENEEVSVMYMTGRIGLHPIFAELGLWELVKDAHASARQENNEADKKVNDSVELDREESEYEAVVATLYEMLGYGIPAEELARFASWVSEQNGWFRSERGQALLMLARRLCIRRAQGQVSSTPVRKSDLDIMSPSSARRDGIVLQRPQNPKSTSEDEFRIVEMGWCHPAAQSSRRATAAESARRPGTQNLLDKLEEKMPSPGGNYMKRAAVTSMAYLGSSVVVTGGLDGGVFMARRVRSPSDLNGAPTNEENIGMRGVHLDWGSSGSRYAAGASSTSLDGEYGVGAVSCLAATRGSTLPSTVLSSKAVISPLEDEDLLEAMEGCRVVAGTTCGDLRVWSVKDVFSAVFYANEGNVAFSQMETKTTQKGEDRIASTFMSRKKGGTDFAAGSSLTRLKFSLRGRALSGHRGGVSCIDVHSNVYRPDSIVSGGADGLIKLWSLKSPGTTGRRNIGLDPAASKLSTDNLTPRSKAARSGDALNILSGHGGRILCVKTAWHGDRLLSGGADRTVRLWDLTGGGGKSLSSLTGHFGWVTSVQYWGPNTIVSASTDRSVALWDARVGNSPLFTLRHHHAPISDMLVGPRTDPIMFSASNDGTVATWDFRCLTTGSENKSGPAKTPLNKTSHCKVVRQPVATLNLDRFSKGGDIFGPVRLSRGPDPQRKTILCLGSDAVTREWDVASGDIVSEHVTGHCDTISVFASLEGDQLTDNQMESIGPELPRSTITASWDGTVRMRTYLRK
jgi:WD40 repeat protein